jgi:hypothetical protein
MRCVQSLDLLSVRRSRHVTYVYYHLWRQSSTECERHSWIERSKQKLPFVFRA